MRRRGLVFKERFFNCELRFAPLLRHTVGLPTACWGPCGRGSKRHGQHSMAHKLDPTTVGETNRELKQTPNGFVPDENLSAAAAAASGVADTTADAAPSRQRANTATQFETRAGVSRVGRL